LLCIIMIRGRRYDTIDNILKIIEDHNELIGVCLDIGHLARSGDSIVDTVMKFGECIYGLHLKDINNLKKM